MSGFNDMWYFVLSYALIIIMGYLLINFLSNGFLGTFLRVKASRGKRVLMEVHAITDVYYTSGVFVGKILKYTTRGKKEKSLTVNQGQVIRKIGVFCIITDEVNDNVLDINFNAESGGNTEDYDHLLKRVMMAPQIENMREKIIIGLLVLILVVVVISAVIGFNSANQVTQLLQGARTV